MYKLAFRYNRDTNTLNKWDGFKIESRHHAALSLIML